MEIKQIVRSNSNVIFTRQTCGQRSSMAAGGKRRALAYDFSVRIFYVFLMSKCREESDLGLRMTSVLAKRMPLCSADFRFETCLAARFVGSQHCAAALSLQVLKSCTDLNSTLLCISILGTCSKFVWKNKMLSLGVCLPQPCLALAAGFPPQDHVWIDTNNLFRFHNNKFDEIPRKLDSTEYERSFRNTRPCLKVFRWHWTKLNV